MQKRVLNYLYYEACYKANSGGGWWLVFHTIKNKVHLNGNVNHMNEGYFKIISPP